MAVVVYKCDVCKRNIELQRKIESIERIQRCTITHGCRGKLYQTRVNPDFVRGQIPPDVSGLDNWQQRKVLHNHSQAIEKNIWHIVHNLGTFPAITAFVDRPIEGDLENRQELIPDDIIVIDPNTIDLVFERPWSGIAQLVARQSDPDLLQPFTRDVEEVEIPQQISNSGEITIATRIKSDDNPIGEPTQVGIQLTYTTTQGTNLVVQYKADDQPTINSAWADFNKVVIKGRIYTVRSFNAIVPEMVSGTIANGSTVLFTGIDEDNDDIVREITNDEVILLLSNDPYEIFDKIDDHYIDTADATADVNPFAFFYDNGEFQATTNVIQTIYPPIRSI